MSVSHVSAADIKVDEVQKEKHGGEQAIVERDAAAKKNERKEWVRSDTTRGVEGAGYEDDYDDTLKNEALPKPPVVFVPRPHKPGQSAPPTNRNEEPVVETPV
ncbi:hypothetical protein FRB99_002179 [Tulasnella sp. 403]|nr:hypothetical protein FRB99_002179 [Tulasnella sp. 403]